MNTLLEILKDEDFKKDIKNNLKTIFFYNLGLLTVEVVIRLFIK